MTQARLLKSAQLTAASMTQSRRTRLDPPGPSAVLRQAPDTQIHGRPGDYRAPGDPDVKPLLTCSYQIVTLNYRIVRSRLTLWISMISDVEPIVPLVPTSPSLGLPQPGPAMRLTLLFRQVFRIG